MNREIKFRAWDTVENEMIENLQDRCGLSADLKCCNHIIEQYTGLKDKNGKEIWEGDIVEYDYEFLDDKQRQAVHWSTDGYWIPLVVVEYGYNAIDSYHKNTFEIIGTIHDKEESSEHS